MTFLTRFLINEYIYESPVNGKIKVVARWGKKTLFVDGVPQSGGEFVAMWQKVIRDSRLKERANCLVLGVGGGTVIESIRQYAPKSTITGIEIDPVIIKIAGEHFSMFPDSRLKILNKDAKIWLKSVKQHEKHHLIIVDLFNGITNPSWTRKKTFLLLLKKLLVPSGQILFNAHYEPQNPREFEQFFTTCSLVCKEVKVVFAYRYNRVLSLEM